MKEYIDNKTRINLKFYFPALGTVFALQRRKWFGWKTTSWIYPSCVVKTNKSWVKQSLLREEREKGKERDIGEKIMRGK